MTASRRPTPAADDPLGPCRRCDAAVPADAATCPSCGYDVASHDRRRLYLGSVGTLLTLSGVFAPVGLPLLWAASRQRRRAAGSVTAAEGTPLGSHLAAVLLHHLDLAPPSVGRGEFTRGGSSGRVAANRPPEL